MASSLDPRNLFDVKGIVAVITGGGSGIGLMIAKTLAVNGAERVYVLGRRAEVLDAGAKKSGTTNIIVPIVTDVTSKESLLAAATQIASEIGYVNVVIANAGQGGPRHQFTPETSIAEFQSALWNVDFNEYLQTFATNTAGVWYTVVAFLDLLDKGNKKGNVTQSSQVISLGSVAGFNRASPGNYAYAQSKAATTHLMKQLATALVRYGIRSNMIAPGLYPSDTAAPMLARFNNVFPKTIVPVERIGTEEDMAGCILYLTSKAGAYLSGAVMLTDGGSLSILPATY